MEKESKTQDQDFFNGTDLKDIEEDIKKESPSTDLVPEVSTLRKMIEFANVMEEMRKIAIAKLKTPTVYDYGTDRPYLSGDALIPIAKDFLVSTTDFQKITGYYNDEKGQVFFCEIRGRVAWISNGKVFRQLESIGYCDTRNKFFGKISHKDEKGKDNVILKSLSEIDRRDIINTAYKRFLRIGVINLLGLNNVTWEELESIAKIDRNKCQKIAFHAGFKGGDKTMTENQKSTIENMFVNLKKKIGGDVNINEYCIENAGVKFSDFKFSDASKIIKILSSALNEKKEK